MTRELPQKIDHSKARKKKRNKIIPRLIDEEIDDEDTRKYFSFVFTSSPSAFLFVL